MPLPTQTDTQQAGIIRVPLDQVASLIAAFKGMAAQLEAAQKPAEAPSDNDAMLQELAGTDNARS